MVAAVVDVGHHIVHRVRLDLLQLLKLQRQLLLGVDAAALLRWNASGHIRLRS